MKLLGVRKDENWLYSEWNLTYRVGWEHICKAASLIYQYTQNPEIFTGDAYDEKEIKVDNADGVLEIGEAGSLTIRGVSDILKIPVLITFYNQLDLVKATVWSATEEFAEADYKNFNLSMCQFMDSIEIAMYE